MWNDTYDNINFERNDQLVSLRQKYLEICIKLLIKIWCSERSRTCHYYQFHFCYSTFKICAHALQTWTKWCDARVKFGCAAKFCKREIKRWALFTNFYIWWNNFPEIHFQSIISSDIKSEIWQSQYKHEYRNHYDTINQIRLMRMVQT